MSDEAFNEVITWRQAIEHVLRDAAQPLPYREIALRIVASGFPTAGQTPERTVSRELTTHPEVFKRVGDGVYELARLTAFEHLNDSSEVEELFASVEPLSTAAHGGQGFQSIVQVRRATEMHAMRSALAHFARQGWQVEDVSSRMPFDLMCTRSKHPDLKVEVKGTTGDGNKILLTRGEVNYARSAFPNMALYILHHIGVEVNDTGVATYGGSPRIILPWKIHADMLEPLSYSYSVSS
jgi:hypothetical protein